MAVWARAITGSLAAADKRARRERCRGVGVVIPDWSPMPGAVILSLYDWDGHLWRQNISSRTAAGKVFPAKAAERNGHLDHMEISHTVSQSRMSAS